MQYTFIWTTMMVVSGIVNAKPFIQPDARKASTRVSSTATRIDNAATSTCSWIIDPSPTARSLHCDVQGSLNPKKTNYLYTTANQSHDSCKTTCINDVTTPNAGGDRLGCVAYGWNATSLRCQVYGLNLVQMGLKVVPPPAADADMFYANYQCYLLSCAVALSSSSSSSIYISTSGSPSIISQTAVTPPKGPSTNTSSRVASSTTSNIKTSRRRSTTSSSSTTSSALNSSTTITKTAKISSRTSSSSSRTASPVSSSTTTSAVASLVTMTMWLPSSMTGYVTTVGKTVFVVTPSAGYVTTFIRSGATWTTQTISTASLGSSGVVEVVQPASTNTAIKWLNSDSAAWTSTIAATGTDLNEIIVGSPSARYDSTTITSGSLPASTMTVSTASAGFSGLIEVIVPMPTYTTWLPATATPFTSTLSDSVVVGSPSAGYRTQTSYYSGHTSFTSTLASASQGTSGVVVVGIPQETGFVYTTSWGTSPSTMIIATPTRNVDGTVLVVRASSSGYLTSTKYGSSAFTSTISRPFEDTDGVVELMYQSSTDYIYSTAYANISQPQTTTLSDPYETSNGQILVISPSATQTLTRTTYLFQNETGYTSILAQPTNDVPGKAVVGIPSGGTVTQTITSGTSAYVTTLQTGSGTSAGTVQYVVAQSTTTITTFIPQNSTMYTSSIPVDGETPGTVIIGTNSAQTSTLTSFWLGNSTYTTVLATGSDAQPGTAAVVYPSETRYTTIATRYSNVTSIQTLATPSDSQLGSVVQVLPSSTGYTTVRTIYANGTLSTQTLAAPTDGNQGSVVLVTPSASYYTTTVFYGNASTYTTTVADPTDSISGTVDIYQPSYITTTVYGGASRAPATLGQPGANGQGTIVVMHQSAGTVYTTTFLPNSPTTTYTKTLATASDAASGTIEVYQASAGTTTQTSYIPTDSAGSTNTASGTNTQSGTVQVYTQSAGTITTTYYMPSDSPASTVTAATATNAQSGTVQVYQPSAGYKTITTYYTVPAGSASTAYISTISSAYQSSSGTIGYFYPSATGYVTVHTTVGSASSTYTVQPSGTVSGTVVQGVPAATQAACYNQGTSWAYWNNSQGANDGSGYKSFDPTLYKKMKPIYNSTTSLMGGISQAGTSDLVSIYGTPKIFVQTYFVLLQRGFIYATTVGQYNFSCSGTDDSLFAWTGDSALNGWTKSNAIITSSYGATGSQYYTFTTTVPNQYVPFRIEYTNAQGYAAFNLQISGPQGILADSTTAQSQYIVQYGCGGSTPVFGDWGNET